MVWSYIGVPKFHDHQLYNPNFVPVYSVFLWCAGFPDCTVWSQVWDQLAASNSTIGEHEFLDVNQLCDSGRLDKHRHEFQRQILPLETREVTFDGGHAKIALHTWAVNNLPCSTFHAD